MRNPSSSCSVPQRNSRNRNAGDSPRRAADANAGRGFGGRGSSLGTGRRILYVEGPGDRGILRAWCYRLLPTQGPALLRNSVILGGRRPERAIDHFARAASEAQGVRGLCVLDRDDEHAWPAPSIPGLEFFTWGRRHIESYLLVPAAVMRATGSAATDAPRLERALRDHLPSESNAGALRQLDAKRLLGPNGPLARALGRPLPLAQIARVTREEELHPDVLDLFVRLRALAG